MTGKLLKVKTERESHGNWHSHDPSSIPRGAVSFMDTEVDLRSMAALDAEENDTIIGGTKNHIALMDIDEKNVKNEFGDEVFTYETGVSPEDDVNFGSSPHLAHEREHDLSEHINPKGNTKASPTPRSKEPKSLGAGVSARKQIVGTVMPQEQQQEEEEEETKMSDGNCSGNDISIEEKKEELKIDDFPDIEAAQMKDYGKCAGIGLFITIFIITNFVLGGASKTCELIYKIDNALSQSNHHRFLVETFRDVQLDVQNRAGTAAGAEVGTGVGTGVGTATGGSNLDAIKIQNVEEASLGGVERPPPVVPHESAPKQQQNQFADVINEKLQEIALNASSTKSLLMKLMSTQKEGVSDDVPNISGVSDLMHLLQMNDSLKKKIVEGDNIMYREKIEEDNAEGHFECGQCAKVFSHRGNLTVHEQTHNLVKRFTCKLCGHGFVKKQNLENHVRTHTGEKPFVCQKCNRGFSQRSNLNRHMRTHTGVKPFGCNTCGKRYVDKRSLENHQQKVHKKDDAKKKKKKKTTSGKRKGQQKSSESKTEKEQKENMTVLPTALAAAAVGGVALTTKKKPKKPKSPRKATPSPPQQPKPKLEEVPSPSFGSNSCSQSIPEPQLDNQITLLDVEQKEDIFRQPLPGTVRPRAPEQHQQQALPNFSGLESPLVTPKETFDWAPFQSFGLTKIEDDDIFNGQSERHQNGIRHDSELVDCVIGSDCIGNNDLNLHNNDFDRHNNELSITDDDRSALNDKFGLAPFHNDDLMDNNNSMDLSGEIDTLSFLRSQDDQPYFTNDASRHHEHNTPLLFNFNNDIQSGDGFESISGEELIKDPFDENFFSKADLHHDFLCWD